MIFPNSSKEVDLKEMSF